MKKGSGSKPKIVYRKARNALWSTDGEYVSSCYLCGGNEGGREYACHAITGIKNEFDIKEVASWFKRSPDFIEKYLEDGVFCLPYHINRGIELLPITFHVDNTALFPICGPCQALVGVPFFKNEEVRHLEEVTMGRTILMTGRAMGDPEMSSIKKCYLCGRPERSMGLSFDMRFKEGTTIRRGDPLLSKISLRVVKVVVDEVNRIKFKYLICSECEILLGVSPRILFTVPEEKDSEEDKIDMGEFNSSIAGIRSGDPTAIKRAIKYITCFGPEYFLQELLLVINNEEKNGTDS